MRTSIFKPSGIFHESYNYYLQKGGLENNKPEFEICKTCGQLLMYHRYSFPVNTQRCLSEIELMEMNIPLLPKLPSKPRRKFPREMTVSIDNRNWFKHLVLCKVPKRKDVVSSRSGINGEIIELWKYAKEIE